MKSYTLTLRYRCVADEIDKLGDIAMSLGYKCDRPRSRWTIDDRLQAARYALYKRIHTTGESQ